MEPNCPGLQGLACEGEKSGTSPGKKAGRYQAFRVARFEDREMSAKAWEEKWLESVKAVEQRWQRVSSWQRRSLFQNDWDHLVYVNTFYFTVWEECK